jgi:hypothetical protein
MYLTCTNNSVVEKANGMAFNPTTILKFID